MMEINLSIYYIIYFFMMSCLMFCYFYKHLLLTIISLEFMVIFTIFNMFHLFMFSQNFYLLIFFMIVSVCEGAMALTLIVLLVRFYGNDYINSLLSLKW